MLKKLLDIITRSIHNLYKVTVIGEVPKDWKKASVAPTLKKGKEEAGKIQAGQTQPLWR